MSLHEDALIARLEAAMDAYDQETLGDDAHELDSWRLLYDAYESLRARLPETHVTEGHCTLKKGHPGSCVILARHPEPTPTQSRPTVADMRDALERIVGWCDPKNARTFTPENRLAEIEDAATAALALFNPKEES